MAEQDELDAAYLNGKRTAWIDLIRVALRELGYDGAEAERAGWIVEREEAIAKLREVCADHGDNDWTPSLHLADIIEKHLCRHLE